MTAPPPTALPVTAGGAVPAPPSAVPPPPPPPTPRPPVRCSDSATRSRRRPTPRPPEGGPRAASGSAPRTLAPARTPSAGRRRTGRRSLGRAGRRRRPAPAGSTPGRRAGSEVGSCPWSGGGPCPVGRDGTTTKAEYHQVRSRQGHHSPSLLVSDASTHRSQIPLVPTVAFDTLLSALLFLVVSPLAP